MTTYAYIVGSVLEALKEHRDDADLKRDVVIFWTQVETNRLRSERLAKRSLQSGQYLNHFYGIKVMADSVRKYVEMPSGIIDIENDNGIHLVTYHLEDYNYCEYPYEVPFEKTTPAEIWALKSIPLRKPSPTRPFMAREKDKLFLYGIESISVKEIDMWLYTTVSTSHVLDLNEDCGLSDDQVSLLIPRIFKLAQFASLLPNDKTNTGSDENTAQIAKTAMSQINPETQQTQQ